MENAELDREIIALFKNHSPLNAATIFSEAFCAGLLPDPDLTVTEWADSYRMLPKKSSSEPGKYRSSRTPYFREVMDSLSSCSAIQEIVIMKGTQLGATELGNNWFGYVADVSPGPMMMIFPTAELAKDHSKQKLQPTIEDTPRLKSKISEYHGGDNGNTMQTKEFPGGILFLSGSNSAAFFRSKSIRFLFLDDVDGFEADVGDEGDPVELARKRTDTFGKRKKILEVSTPTTKGISRIERSFLESDQRYYHVPCPHCGEYQRLEWGGDGADHGIRFNRDNHGTVESVWYECRHCHQRIDEHHKTEMLERGHWIPTHPEREKRGYQISSIYSPLGWVSWNQIVDEFLKAKAHKQTLKVWTNTRLGECFEEAGDRPEWTILHARCESYSILTVPAGGFLLSGGVDVQDNRLAVVVRAWGRGEESWLIYWGEIFGNPAQLQVWSDLDNLLSRPFEHVSGTVLHITSAAIDTGGHHTQEAYNFARQKSPRVIAIKGQNKTGKPVIGRPTMQDVTWNGKTIKNGVQLWPVGSDTAKATIYSRLKTTSGSGMYHFPIGTPEDYFIQLTSEKLVTKFVKGYPRQEWTMTGPRNEALDCEVYAYAAAIRAGLTSINWDELERGMGQPRTQTTNSRRVMSRGIQL